MVFVMRSVRLFRLERNGLRWRKPRKHLMKLPTLGLRHGIVRMHGRTPTLGCFLEFALSTLRVKNQQSAIHELFHGTIPLLSNFMNALTKSIQDDALRFSPGLFLSGLKSHSPDSIQFDPHKRIVDRSPHSSTVSRFFPHA